MADSPAKDRPCSDCGISYPTYVMDFDHRDKGQKRFNIGRDALVRGSEGALKEEIEKCDVVCAQLPPYKDASARG